MTKRLGILTAVIVALVAGGLALGLGLMSNSKATATKATPAAHTTITPPPPTAAPPSTTPAHGATPAADSGTSGGCRADHAATPAADNDPSGGHAAGRRQRYSPGQRRRPRRRQQRRAERW